MLDGDNVELLVKLLVKQNEVLEINVYTPATMTMLLGIS